MWKYVVNSNIAAVGDKNSPVANCDAFLLDKT